MAKSFQFTVNTINGEFLEFPKTVTVVCDKIFPLGVSVIRDWNESMCIVSKRVLLIQYGMQTFGTTQFASVAEFDQYRKAICACCSDTCHITLNGCFLMLNGCSVQMY